MRDIARIPTDELENLIGITRKATGLNEGVIEDNALADTALLQKVVDFKTKFYRSPWAKFEDCKPGTLVLALPDYRISELAQDYQAMQEFLIGERPSLNEIMEHLGQLQDEINRLDISDCPL